MRNKDKAGRYSPVKFTSNRWGVRDGPRLMACGCPTPSDAERIVVALNDAVAKDDKAALKGGGDG
jgi:hypothetical protein